MKLSREQQTTFIMITTILVVSLITFIAIFNIIWGIIAQPLGDAITSVSTFLRNQNVDYNFTVPRQVVVQAPAQPIVESPTPQTPIVPEQPATQPEPAPIQPQQPVEQVPIESTPVISAIIDYNFLVPRENKNNATVNFQSFPDAILQDAILAGYGSGSDTPQVNLQISIPKIGVNSPVLQGLGADDLLERGFWIYPGSNTLGKGEVVMLCHRRFFGPYDPRSCWFLDKMKVGDEILMKYSEAVLRYEVVGVNVFEGDDPLIYSISNSDDYIKIVTCTPLYSNAQRLVVLAKRSN